MTIKLVDISKAYDKKARNFVLEDVNLEIETGSFVMLKGASGAGKSTLLSIIGGIEPATSGEVIIDGTDATSLRGKARADFYRHKIGFIFQGFYLQPQLTVANNIALTGIFAGMAPAERRARAEELAKRLGIEKVLDMKPAEISGGQAERACAARAIFMKPEIILADEPTNNLDPENARNVIELLKQIRDEMRATMIIASHDSLVEKYAERIVTVKDGRVR